MKVYQPRLLLYLSKAIAIFPPSFMCTNCYSKTLIKLSVANHHLSPSLLGY